MILRLGHVELTVDDLGAARAFWVDLLGLDVHHVEDGRLYLRASEEFDAWSLLLTQASGPGLGHLAFRTSSEDDLEALARLHARLGLPCERVAAGVEPAQGAALRARTPSGHPIEFYHRFDELVPASAEAVRLPMRRSHERCGVPPTRLDHVNIRVAHTPTALEYWRDELSFSASELWLQPDGTPRTAWVRRSSGTHDVAIGQGDAPGLHHVAYLVADQAALVRAVDLLADAGLAGSIDYGPSRHGATNALCLYIRDPAGNRLELYTGDYVRDLDRPPVVWSADEYARSGHSWWGQPPGDRFRDAAPVRSTDWPGTDPQPLAART